jgi:bifunctional non-homologous end joining protein LigD
MASALQRGQDAMELTIARRKVRLTNLDKVFFPEIGVRKGDLLRYYMNVAPVLLPHLKGRAMVLKRYPGGAAGEFFFMKRAPAERPPWVEICTIPHHAGPIDFAVVNHLASLLWVVNLGSIDLNPWYARCDDLDRPDYLHFDLDPVPGAGFDRVREAALRVREALSDLRIPSYPKTSGSRGIHVYVPIRRGPAQKQVWSFAKETAKALAARFPDLITAEYRVATRPAGRVLVDYNPNAWGRTLASAYSVRPAPRATVSTPLTWQEVERGCRTEDFRIDNMPLRVKAAGDLWKPMVARAGRVDLSRFL